MSPISRDPIAVTRASFEAYVSKDRAMIEAVIAPNFHFTSPLDNRIDRAAYFRRCWPISETVKSFDFKRLHADGNEVYVTYEGENMDGHRFRNTEVFTIRDGKIVEVEVYFGWNVPHKAKPGGWLEGSEAAPE